MLLENANVHTQKIKKCRFGHDQIHLLHYLTCTQLKYSKHKLNFRNNQRMETSVTVEQRRRMCRLCKSRGPQSETTQVKQKRHAVLRQWYPKQIRTPSDWCHKVCLAQLGLYPFPEDPEQIERLMGNAVTERIRQVVADLPHILGPRRLIEAVYEQIRGEYRVPIDVPRNDCIWYPLVCAERRPQPNVDDSSCATWSRTGSLPTAPQAAGAWPPPRTPWQRWRNRS